MKYNQLGDFALITKLLSSRDEGQQRHWEVKDCILRLVICKIRVILWFKSNRIISRSYVRTIKERIHHRIDFQVDYKSFWSLKMKKSTLFKMYVLLVHVVLSSTDTKNIKML